MINLYNQKKSFLKLKLSVFSCILIITGVQNQLAGQCNPPILTTFGNRTENSIRVNWLYAAGANAYELEMVKEGAQFTGEPGFGPVPVNFMVLSDLKTNTQYCLRIRSVCDNLPGPWSAPHCFYSSLSNPGFCDLDYNLQDASENSDPKNNMFYLYNDQNASAKLGEDVFIENVSLVIEHNWPNDLDIELTSPSGKKLTLVSKVGKGAKNFGDPESEDCSETISFSDDACLNIEETLILTGVFKPQQSFEKFYDLSSPEGIWILNIRDNKYGHAGKLKYFSIQLAQNACRLPNTYYVEPIGPTRATVRWDTTGISRDTLEIEYGQEGFIPGEGIKLKFPAKTGQMTITNLREDLRYTALIRTVCDTIFSVTSCPVTFEPLCHPVSFKDKFESAEVCINDCDTNCDISPYWKNAGPPFMKWLVNKGKTNTEGTGPNEDFYRFGQYIYAESSQNSCELNRQAVLESRCLNIVSNEDGCDFQFSYHMFGSEMGSIHLMISVDGGSEWHILFSITGNQGNVWQTQSIDLSAYDGMIGRFRLIADLPENGERSDIALDEIVFFGSFPVNEANQTFYVDTDNDGFGDPFQSDFFCWNEPKSGYAGNKLDCDDADPLINPSAHEIPCNGLDENCNGMADDLDQESPMEIIIEAKADETCYGSMDGYIHLNITGGQAPYQFLWSDGSVGALLDQKGAGAYHCQITDALGCVIHAKDLEIKAGQPIEIQILDQTIATCQGTADGYILVSQTGGEEPVTYLWNTGHRANELTGIGPGIYQLTVTDAKGCAAISQSIELTASTVFNIEYTIRPPLCHGDNKGSILIDGILNGTPPYTYQWSNGAETDDIYNLSPGFYAVTIHDSGQCYEVLDSLFVPESPLLTIQLIAKDDVTCNGSTDGSLEVQVKGGKPPYFYLWYKNGKLFSTNEDLFDLGAGDYRLILSDHNGCEITSELMIVHQPDPIQIVLDQIKHPSCFASADGMISALVDGGSGDYAYFWNGDGSNGSSYSGLNPGIYSLVVTDKNGCKGIRNGIELESLNLPILNRVELLDSLKCFGDQDASLRIEVQDVLFPIDYNWSNGIKVSGFELSDTLHHLGAGNYKVTITDAAGCIGSSAWVEIAEPDRLSYKIDILQDIRCYGERIGAVELEIFGGTKPFSILWNNNLVNAEIYDLPAGYYVADIQDKNGCSLKTDSIWLYQPDPLEIFLLVDHATNGMNNGKVTVVPSGGTSPYFYQWDSSAGYQTTQVVSGLTPGIYHVTITDFNDCVFDTIVIITGQTAVETASIDRLKLHPNPTAGRIFIDHQDFAGQKFDMKIIDPVGKVVMETSGIWPVDGIFEIQAESWDAGICTVIIRNAGKVYRERFIKIRI
ncbi:MAG TPA: proprotein convertase P-domain-containing protein [Saprospiraceae bacterium]|nr:proprotein convertase P-domain-containing protein [Saprospiraceae bacterium]